jgi:hypothetical protein
MKIQHSLQFVTEFKDGHPITEQVMALPETMRIQMLESMLKDLIAPKLQPILDKVNENASYAILSVAN